MVGAHVTGIQLDCGHFTEFECSAGGTRALLARIEHAIIEVECSTCKTCHDLALSKAPVISTAKTEWKN